MKAVRIMPVLFGTTFGIFLIYLTSLIPSVYVEPELESKFNNIKTLIEKTCKKYSFPAQYTVTFEELEGEEVGVCEKNLFNWRIKIDSRMWKYFKEAQQVALISHEVLHCALNIEHDDSKLGIMNSFLPKDITLEQVNEEINNILKGCE